jgi:hypothetical protein
MKALTVMMALVVVLLASGMAMAQTVSVTDSMGNTHLYYVAGMGTGTVTILDNQTGMSTTVTGLTPSQPVRGGTDLNSINAELFRLLDEPPKSGW